MGGVALHRISAFSIAASVLLISEPSFLLASAAAASSDSTSASAASAATSTASSTAAPGAATVAAAAAAPEAAFLPLLSCRSETEFLQTLESLGPSDLRPLPFTAVETLVAKSWWRAATGVVVKSHQAKLDFTAPVRRATADVKREADQLLKWLDPRFANPAATPMATKWAQNRTTVMLAARFAARWDGPGANFAVFSSDKGRGHIDVQKTEERVHSLLKVNLTESSLYAEILADETNIRKRYVLNVTLFDELVPDRSEWSLHFRRAQGSMQMSTGAQIAELQMILRKRWPDERVWPRLAMDAPPEGVNEAPNQNWWWDAPGLTAEDAPTKHRTLVSSGSLCSRTGLVYCRASDSCVESCEANCEKAEVLRPSGPPRCIESPQVDGGGGCLPLPEDPTTTSASSPDVVDLPEPTKPPIVEASFLDEDLRSSSLEGDIRWGGDATGMSESFDLFWVRPCETEVLMDDEPLATVDAGNVDSVFTFRLPAGSQFPAEVEVGGAARVVIFATNAAGRERWACVDLVDRARPLSPKGIQFTDTDGRRNWAGGVVEIEIDEDPAPADSGTPTPAAIAYEIRWGAEGQEEQALEELESSSPPIASVRAGQKSEGKVQITLPKAGAKVSKEHPLLLAYAVGPGGARSLPVSLRFQDAAPPTVHPRRLKASPDANPKARLATLELTITAGTCDSTAKKGKNSGSQCDLGTDYVVYWADAHGAKLTDEPIGVVPVTNLQPIRLESVIVPSGASMFLAVTRNSHGETVSGATTAFKDIRSESDSAWNEVIAVAACTTGSVAVWRPLGNNDGGASEAATDDPASVPWSGQPIDAPKFRLRSISSVARGRGDPLQIALGQEDGSVALLHWIEGSWQVSKSVSGGGGGGATAYLSYDIESSMLVRGGKLGQVELWNMAEGKSVTKMSSGGSANIVRIDVHWESGRAVSATSDGKIKLWNLQTGECLHTAGSINSRAFDLVVDWSAPSPSTPRALVALFDETLKLLQLSDTAEEGGEKAGPLIFEGHSEPVRLVSANFEGKRALSVSADRVAKLWDLDFRECLLTFSVGTSGSVAAMAVKWEFQEALFLREDGSTALYDLSDGRLVVEREPRCSIKNGVVALS